MYCYGNIPKWWARFGGNIGCLGEKEKWVGKGLRVKGFGENSLKITGKNTAIEKNAFS
jgi:hypothetical protein